MQLGIDFFGISEDLHRELSLNPTSEVKGNSIAEFNREKNELKEYMNIVSALFNLRSRYMSEEE